MPCSSIDEEQYSDQSDGEGPPILQPADTEVGEIEEGEIIDSGDDEPPIIETGESGLPVGDFKQTEESATEGEATSIKRKKKKKKKRRKPGSQDEDSGDQGQSGDDKPKKPKRKKYIDHDQVHDDDYWYSKRSPDYDSNRSPLGPYDSPVDSSYEDDIDDRYGDGPDQNGIGRYKKKRGLLHGGPDKKRMRGGGQRRGHRMGPRRDIRSRTLCKFFREGKCAKGSDCTFAHEGKPPRKPEICKFYLNGYCSKGDNCMFMHNEFPCKFFHTGSKCYSADKCKFSHEPLSDDGRRLLDKHLEIFHDDEPGSNQGNIGSPTKQLPPPQSSNQRPSLLGSPPRHIKEMAESYKKIPSLFEIHVGVPNPGMPLASPPPAQSGAPVRPNFYTDTIKVSPMRPPLLPMPPPGYPSANRLPFSPPGEKEQSPPPLPPMQNLRVDEHSPLRMEMDPSIEMKMEPIERPKEVDIRRISEDDENTDLRFDEETDKLREKGNSSESESEGKKVSPSIAIPSHLPKKQRELFLRIQQQQREAESSQEDSDKNAKKDDEENEVEENWYSSDDDEEDGDQPLAAMLKKLQQQPPQSKSSQPAAASPHPVFDIAKMLSTIRNQANNNNNMPSGSNTVKTENRDPRLTQQDSEPREMRNEIRDPRMRRDPRLEQNRDLRPDPSKADRDMRLEYPIRDLKESKPIEHKRDPRMDRDFRQVNCETTDLRSQLREVKSLEHDMGPLSVAHKTNAEGRGLYSVPYRLHTVSVSHPNYGNLLLGHNDPRLQNDPRLRRQSSIELPSAARQNQNNNHPSDSDNKPSDLRTKKQESNHNGFTGEPHSVPNLSTSSTRVDPRMNGPARADPRINRSDPRTARLTSANNGGASQPSEPSASSANALGKHLGLPGVPPSRERSVVPKSDLRSQDPRLKNRTENKISENAKDESSASKDTEPQPAPSKLKGGSFQRKSSLDYASPLGYHDSDCSSQGSYSNYNRRPQQRTLAVSAPPSQAATAVSTAQNSVSPLVAGELKEPVDIPSLEIEETFEDSLSNTSLKEVFKTIDPTASPFC